MTDHNEDEGIPPEVESLAWMHSLLSRGTGIAEVREYAGAHDRQLRSEWRADVRRVASLADARRIDPRAILLLCDLSQISDEAIAAAYCSIELLMLRFNDAVVAAPVISKANLTRIEQNALLRLHLVAKATAGEKPTWRSAMEAAQCSTEVLKSLPAWIAYKGELKKGRKPKFVQLNPSMAAVTENKEGDEALAKLTRQQRRDDRSNRVVVGERT